MSVSDVVGIDAAVEPQGMQAVYKRIAWRILPFIFFCYILNFIDRVNISFAHLQFQSDLGMSNANYGFGVGIYYVGYILCEIPAMLMLSRIGARRTIARIMISWGVVSVAMMFIKTPTQFYVARFFLGATEGGFFPAIVVYLTYWFPVEWRGRVTSRILFGIPVAGVLGSLGAGLIMNNLDTVFDLRGWQWLFFLEGLLPIVAGVFVFFYLIDRPHDAGWLTQDERAWVVAQIDTERSAIQAKSPGKKQGTHRNGFFTAFRNPKVFICSLAYFSVPWSSSILSYWSPSIIRQSGVSNVWHVGLLGTLPYLIGALGMLAICRSSDYRLERRWHFALCCLLVAASGCALIWFGYGWQITIFWLSLMTIGYLGATALFWTIPPAYLTGAEAAGGFAVISSLGYSGGFMAPAAIGWIQAQTGNLTWGIYAVAGVLVMAGMTVILGIPRDFLYAGDRNAAARRP